MVFKRITATVACFAVFSSLEASSTPLAGVYTWRYDEARTGQNVQETILTTANVNQKTFGKLFSATVDGYVYAQPLYAAGISVPGMGIHNLMFIATEHDSVYAFDADASRPSPIWHRSFINPAAGVTTVPDSDTGETGDLIPEFGVTGTPVINPATRTLYVVANTKEYGPTYPYRLHALDLATGNEKPGSPVQINARGFVQLHHMQRPALLLQNGILYIAFGSHGDRNSWHGWVMSYNATTLAQEKVYNTTPTGGFGSIWQTGAGPAADSSANIYVETGNGDFDASTGGNNFSQSVIKLSAALGVLDWFAPFNLDVLNNGDIDLGSAGPVVLPTLSGKYQHMLLASGKPGILYLLNRDNMGHFHSGSNSQIIQSVSVDYNTTDVLGGIFGAPTYWNGHVYVVGANNPLKAFSINGNGLSLSPIGRSSKTYQYPGAVPVVSSNGTANGIVWFLEGDGYTPANPATLHAFDANNVAHELYNSAQAGTRDLAGPAVKFTPPVVANGKVYVAGQGQITVYGLLP